MAPTFFGLRSSSGSLKLSLVKVILILKHCVRLRLNLLCGGVAACHSMACVLCKAQNRQAILGHAATSPHNKLRRNLTECFNINITLTRFNFKLPDDDRRPKNVGAIKF